MRSPSLISRAAAMIINIGGAEIDRFGNINTSYIGDIDAPKVKLPGSGGAPDIAAMAERLIIVMNHQKPAALWARERVAPRLHPPRSYP